jgi:hypothetical protein
MRRRARRCVFRFPVATSPLDPTHVFATSKHNCRKNEHSWNSRARSSRPKTPPKPPLNKALTHRLASCAARRQRAPLRSQEEMSVVQEERASASFPADAGETQNQDQSQAIPHCRGALSGGCRGAEREHLHYGATKPRRTQHTAPNNQPTESKSTPSTPASCIPSDGRSVLWFFWPLG